jgi:hypothetical protein
MRWVRYRLSSRLGLGWEASFPSAGIMGCKWKQGVGEQKTVDYDVAKEAGLEHLGSRLGHLLSQLSSHLSWVPSGNP